MKYEIDIDYNTKAVLQFFGAGSLSEGIKACAQMCWELRRMKKIKEELEIDEVTYRYKRQTIARVRTELDFDV